MRSTLAKPHSARLVIPNFSTLAASINNWLIAGLLLLLPWLFVPWCHDGFGWVKAITLWSGAALLGLLTWRSGRWDVASVGVWLLAGTAILSACFSTSSLLAWWGAAGTRLGAVSVLALAVLFEAVRRLPQAEWAWAVEVSAIGCSAYALVQVAGFDPFVWSEVSSVAGYVRPAGPLGNSNVLAGYLAMCWPLCRTRAASWLVAGACVLCASRAGWLALAIAVLVNWSSRWRWPFVAVLLSLALLTSAFREDARWHFWQGAISAWADKPILGHGPDTFAMAYPRHRSAEAWRIEQGRTPQHAHCDLLQLLSTQGLAGIAAITLLAWGVVTATWRLGQLHPAERPWLMAWLACLLAWLTQGAVGFSTIPILALVVVGMASIVGRARRDDTPSAITPHSIAALVLAGFVIASLNGAIWDTVEHGRAGEEAGRRFDWPTAAAHFRTMLEWAPEDSAARADYAKALGEIALERGQSAILAWAEFERAMLGDPHNPLIPAEASRIALLQGDLSRAAQYAEVGLRSHPSSGHLLAARGYVEFRQGLLEEAERDLLAGCRGEWFRDTDAPWRALACLGAVMEQRKRPNEALAVYRQVMAGRPDLEVARRGVIRLAGCVSSR